MIEHHDFIMYESDPFTVHTLSEHDKLTQTPCSPRTPGDPESMSENTPNNLKDEVKVTERRF